jgi:hypothetical protein
VEKLWLWLVTWGIVSAHLDECIEQRHIVVGYVSGVGPEKGVDLATELFLKVRLPSKFQ